MKLFLLFYMCHFAMGLTHCYKTTVFYINHKLNGSSDITVWTVVQTVLTATFNSYENRQISTPYKINTLEPIDKKIRHSWLRPRADPVYQIWYKSTHWGLLGKWVKYNKNYFFIYAFFSQARAQVRPVDGFLHAIAQKTWNHAWMCLLGVWMMCP